MGFPDSHIVPPQGGRLDAKGPNYSMSHFRWVLVTGEYPPQPGGVSDYTQLIAGGLACAGDEVHVWAPAPSTSQPAPTDAGVTVHWLPGRFCRRDLANLDRFLSRMPGRCRLLVQYVPHAFGCKGMNVPFCWWLNRRLEPVWVMFHEVAFPLSRKQPLRYNFLGMVTRLMAGLVARRAERIFVAIPGWEALLPKSGRARYSVNWLPVPSNLPTTVSADAVAALRKQVVRENQLLFGHFGTYGPHVTSLLARILPPLLANESSRRVLLLGKGSKEFATIIGNENPSLRGQVDATGPLGPREMAVHLAACDCLVQPYADGVSSRRTSVMAGLALGLPIVTNAGPLTDSVWRETGAVLLAPSPSPADLIDAFENLLAEPRRLAEIRQRALSLYERYFALPRTIEILRTETATHDLAS